jgi:hypothetical protein
MKLSMPRALIAAALCAMLAGCTTEYLITKNDGTVIESHGKPKMDDSTGMLTYHDTEGRTMQMRRDEVKQIIER